MHDLERFIQAQAYNYGDALQEFVMVENKVVGCGMYFLKLKVWAAVLWQKHMNLKIQKKQGEYLAHPLLKSRLQEICEAALETESDNAMVVFGVPDNMKLCSSMTLFEKADPENPIYAKILDKFFDGKRDKLTLQILSMTNRYQLSQNQNKSLNILIHICSRYENYRQIHWHLLFQKSCKIFHS